MKKEKHLCNKTYGGHQLARYIDVYEVSANGCHSVPESGYKGTEATLVDDPAWNEKFSSYSITGATLSGNNFILNNDVTAQANYETAKNVTLQTDGHGSIAANKNSGFIGDQVTLSNTPNANYNFAYYSITGATLTGNKFNFVGNNVTAKANFSAEPVKLFISGGFGTNAGVSPGNDFYGIDPLIIGNTFNVAVSEYGNKTTAAKAVDAVITAFGRPLYFSDYSRYSSYYDSTAKKDSFTYYGYGLKKPIHITDILLVSDNTITGYNMSELSYGSGINGPWYKGTRSDEYNHHQWQFNLDFVTDDKIAIRFYSPSAIVYTHYTGYFTGYILL